MLIKRHNLSPIHFLQPPDIQQKSIVKSFSSEGPAVNQQATVKDIVNNQVQLEKLLISIMLG